MADNVAITAGSGTVVAADEVVDGVLGTVKVQFVKIMDGTLDSSTKAGVGANGLKVDGSAVTQPISPVPRATANGATSSRIVAAASTNATSLKASAGNIARIDIFNVAVYDVFLKFYNKASSPTVGTDTPIWTLPLKAGTGYSSDFLYGKSFSTGIAYAITKFVADSDTTVLVAGDVTGAIDWI